MFISQPIIITCVILYITLVISLAYLLLYKMKKERDSISVKEYNRYISEKYNMEIQRKFNEWTSKPITGTISEIGKEFKEMENSQYTWKSINRKPISIEEQDNSQMGIPKKNKSETPEKSGRMEVPEKQWKYGDWS